MKKHSTYLALLFVISAFSSCEKVIDIDLNSAQPKLVIQADVSDQPGPYTFKLSKTVNYDDPNIFPAVQGALVNVSDDAGNSETLTEISPGVYVTDTFQGVSGRTYFLEVTADDVTYTSVCKMPEPVDIDTLFVQPLPFGDEETVSVRFKDIEGTPNYYRLQYKVNNELKDDILVIDDNLQDGQNIEYYLPVFGEEYEDNPLTIGDTVEVFLQTIDRGAYEYFRTLALLTGSSSGPPSDAPANPISNISDNVLGYFSTYSVRSMTIVIE
ncbi:MAG: hypothetical protein BGO34_22060 [Bacteroidia bacterium 44-10]|nr:MAG: hypothetical protein BGO34_22060 [Bacteroidia bacterium 44-10]